MLSWHQKIRGEGMGLVQFNKVYKQFAGDFILKDISFSIEEKDKIGLVGLNGVGKSTIIKLILGLNSNYAGSIKYDTFDIDTIPTNEMSKIATLITNDSYLVQGSIRSHLSVNKHITEEDMYNALEKVNLKDFVIDLEYSDIDIEHNCFGITLNVKISSTLVMLKFPQKQRFFARQLFLLKKGCTYVMPLLPVVLYRRCPI